MNRSNAVSFSRSAAQIVTLGNVVFHRMYCLSTTTTIGMRTCRTTNHPIIAPEPAMAPTNASAQNALRQMGFVSIRWHGHPTPQSSHCYARLTRCSPLDGHSAALPQMPGTVHRALVEHDEQVGAQEFVQTAQPQPKRRTATATATSLACVRLFSRRSHDWHRRPKGRR